MASGIGSVPYSSRRSKLRPPDVNEIKVTRF
jgi:hypothetical protein